MRATQKEMRRAETVWAATGKHWWRYAADPRCSPGDETSRGRGRRGEYRCAADVQFVVLRPGGHRRLAMVAVTSCLAVVILLSPRTWWSSFPVEVLAALHVLALPALVVAVAVAWACVRCVVLRPDLLVAPAGEDLELEDVEDFLAVVAVSDAPGRTRQALYDDLVALEAAYAWAEVGGRVAVDHHRRMAEIAVEFWGPVRDGVTDLRPRRAAAEADDLALRFAAHARARARAAEQTVGRFRERHPEWEPPTRAGSRR